ncbi:hypothetical protein RRG08_029467 [Elysia crispata]|uniref:DNA mismatch repair protein MutS core domain-containing protein n=1 Tax=Elysia crispata TaxID=231223 RepID=A0AAE1BDF7_9GAST|nr:hypothetical protein RRG08_029467 [Elysia crispata]
MNKERYRPQTIDFHLSLSWAFPPADISLFHVLLYLSSPSCLWSTPSSLALRVQLECMPEFWQINRIAAPGMFASNNSLLPSPSAASARTRPVMDENVEDCDCSREDSVDDLIFSEVYLSLVWHRGQLGLAYYDLSSFQIHVMSDTLETDDFVLTKQVLREIQPRVIIMSSIQDGRLVSYIKKFSSDTSSICSQSSGSKFEPFKLEYLANSEFSYEVSKRRILAMKLPSIPDHLSEEERKMYFASVIPMGQINMVRAIGGLHKYLERNRVGVELEDSLTSVPILGFRTFALENYIQIDTMTYMALNIFDTEVHPSVYKFGGSSGKEGLSLFGILNRCKSSIGARMLRQWFLRPVKNAALLGQRHNAVSFFVTPRNMDVVSCLHGCLKHIKYLPKILWRMSKAQATVGDLEALYKTIYHAFYIGKISRAQPQSVDIFHKIAAAFTEDLQRCANLIHRTIDFEESKKLKKFVIKAHVDKNLDAKKRLFHGVPDILNQVAREELEGLSDEIDHCSASYLPQLGYLLVIDMPDGKTENDDHSIEGLQYKFASNRQLFYKSPRTCELDAQLGDIQLEISDMEVNILHGLQSAVLENSQVLLDVMEMSAELDCLMALATCANEFVYTCPKLVQEEVINIKGGRHPLQEMCCSPYVPNDTVIGGQNSRIQLLTGPNACGKSVYLKQTILKMAAHLETWSKEEIRAVIRFLNAKSLNPTEIHKELQSVYGEHVISRTQVYHWCNLFEAGHSDLTDREGRGRSITATSEDNVKRVDELIRQDRRLKLHEIASSLEISETSAHRIVFDELGYRKVSARWVPKQLTDNHKEQRLDICRELLRRSKSSRRVHGHTGNAGGDFLVYDVTFLDSIVTGDETWLHHCTPETKQDSMTWKHPSSPVAKKFKVMRSAKKIMGTVFWDSRGVLLFETLQPGEIINAARYCQTLDKLREAIRRKRPGQRGHFATRQRYTPHSTSDARLAREIWMGDFATPTTQSRPRTI